MSNLDELVQKYYDKLVADKGGNYANLVLLASKFKAQVETARQAGEDQKVIDGKVSRGSAILTTALYMAYPEMDIEGLRKVQDEIIEDVDKLTNYVLDLLEQSEEDGQQTERG